MKKFSIAFHDRDRLLFGCVSSPRMRLLQSCQEMSLLGLKWQAASGYKILINETGIIRKRPVMIFRFGHRRFNNLCQSSFRIQIS